MPPSLQGFTEAITRHTARGWARDPTAPDRRVLIQAIAHRQVIAQAPADLFRGDVAAAGLGDGNCGFVLDLSAHAPHLGGAEITLRDAETGTVLHGSPAIAADPPSLALFLDRWSAIPAPRLARLRRMMRHRLGNQGVTVITRQPSGVPALLAALKSQLAGRWELLVPPGVPLSDRRMRTLPADSLRAARHLIARHPITLVATGHITLERDALWHLLRAAADPRPTAFLWDFARQHPSGATDLLCRPAFSFEAFASHPDTGGAFAVRTTAPWSDPTDLLLGLAATHPIAQIPRVLHRTTDAPYTATPTDLHAIQRHLPPGATASRTADAITLTFPPATGRTLAIIPTRNNAHLLRACLTALLRTRQDVPLDIVVIDHESDEPETRAYLREIAGLVTIMPYAGKFDFAAMNNQAVTRHGADAETLLFLNNDTEAIAPGWLARMASLATRPGIGAVGALLLYADHRVQHAGVLLGYDGSATHAHTMVQAYRPDGTRAPGYDNQLTALREVSAVTAACMMVPHAAFRAAGGFDPALPVGFNDTDLCLRLRALGYRILHDGQTMLYHHEARTRRPAGHWLHPPDTALFQTRHAALIHAGDPFYNPNLRLDVRDHELRPDCLPGGPPRVIFSR